MTSSTMMHLGDGLDLGEALFVNRLGRTFTPVRVVDVRGTDMTVTLLDGSRPLTAPVDVFVDVAAGVPAGFSQLNGSYGAY